MPDGSLIVAGPCTDATVDRDGQIVDPGFSAKALKEWYEDLGASVRNMHSGTYPPAGKGISLDLSSGTPWIRARITEPTAVRHVLDKVYNDFSVGIFDPEVVPDPRAPGGRIVDGWIGEVSLVDLGSNKNAHFAIAKRASRHARSTLYGVATAVTPKVISAGTRRNRMNIDAAKLEADLQRAMSGAALAGDIAGAAVAAVVTKAATPIFKGDDDADDDVTDGIGDLLDDLADVADAQADDDAEGDDKPTDEMVDAGIEHVGDAILQLSAAQAADQAADTLAGKGGRKCKACKGTGDISGAECAKCMGKGFMPAKEVTKAARTKAAGEWYAAFKRDMDPDVGGGVDRDKLKASDFVFPKTRSFPVVTPADVSDAVSSWGRYKGPETFDSFKSKLTALARRKGAAFVKALPEAWGAKVAQPATSKAADDDTGPGEDKPCKTCKGEGKIRSGGLTCPTCDGKGTMPAKAAKGKKLDVPKGKGKLKPAANPDLPDAVGPDAPPVGNTMGKKGKKASKAAQRIHDSLCPAFSGADIAKAYPGIEGLPLVDVLNPTFFADQLAQLTSGLTKTAAGTIGEAYQAYAAAHKLAALTPPDFESIRDKAHKAFEDAYPTVHVAPGMINPADFKRPFLPGSTPEVSTTTTVPEPDLKPSLEAGDFDRGALTDNETRPSLTGGTSVTGYSGKGKKAKKAAADDEGAVPAPGPSRLFYRKADPSDADSWGSTMALLHDHIAQHYPGSCPMNPVEPGSNIDSDGLMGTPAEMNATHPGLPPLRLPSNQIGALVPAKSATADKGAAEASIDRAAVETLIEERVAQAIKAVTRKTAKRERVLKSKLAEAQKSLRLPDPRFAARTRGQDNFRPRPVDPDTALAKGQQDARVRELKTRVADRDSSVSQRAQAELMRILPPEEFAQVLVGD